jgi:hypothetical protein
METRTMLARRDTQALERVVDRPVGRRIDRRLARIRVALKPRSRRVRASTRQGGLPSF